MTDIPASPGPPGGQGTPGPVAAQAARPPEDPYGLARKLRAEADAVEAAAPVPPGHARLKVEPPHESLTWGGTRIGPEFTAVHPSLVPSVMQAADEAGVTLTEEGQAG